MIVNFLTAAFLAGAPLILATVGEIVTEKSGNINLGVEGTMYIGAVSGLAAAVGLEKTGFTGWLLVLSVLLASFLAGMLTSVIYGVFTITLRVNQNVTGLTITILGTGIGNFFGEIMGQNAGGYVSVTEETKSFFAATPFGGLAAVPVVGKLLFSYNWMVYLALIIAVLAYVILARTRAGMRLKAVGENPSAADAAGISVGKYRYIATALGGGLCGMAGMYMCMVTDSGVWVHDCISGYGWLAVALVIFSGWNVLAAVPCSIVFGALMIMRLYISIPGISPFIYDMCPYIVTSLVMIGTSMRKRKTGVMPEGCGVNYFREER